MPWVESLDEVNERAVKEKKLILAYFYADWCGFCKKFDATAAYDPSIVLLSEEFIPVRINGDERPEMSKQYKVESLPTLVMVDTNGKAVIYAYKSDLEKAEAVYDWVVKEDLEDKQGLHFPMHRARAPLYDRARDYEKSVVHYEPQIPYLTHPYEITQASFYLGNTYHGLGQGAKAIEAFEFMLTAPPANSSTEQKNHAQRLIQESRQRIPAQ